MGVGVTRQMTHGTPAEIAEYCRLVGEEVPPAIALAAGMALPPRPLREGPAPSAAEAMLEAGVPPVVMARMADLARPMPEEAGTWLHELRSTRPPWLWLMGGSGAGKSCTAAWALGEAVSRGLVARGLMASAEGLAERWDGANLYGQGGKAQAVAAEREAPLLVIDGLGEEPPCRGALDALWAVVCWRHDRMLPTVLTSQLSGADYRDRLARFDRPKAAALFSRIMAGLSAFGGGRETTMRHVVELGSPDLRAGGE